MIVLVHGNNSVNKADVVFKLSEKISTPRKYLSIDENSPTDVLTATATNNMFTGAPIVILDLGSNTKSDAKSFLDIFPRVPAKSLLILLAQKELPKSNQFLQHAQQQGYKIILSNTTPTANIFSFVSSLYSKNRKKTYREYETLIAEGADPFYILSMVMFGARKQAKAVNGDKIDEKTLSLYKYIFETDLKTKTGKIPVDVALPLIIEKVLTS